jgi:hypothetical protein
LEPFVSVSGKNEIVRRNISKASSGGTVKERWSQDDYEVTITGVISGLDENKYPTWYIKKLIGLFEQRQSVEVDQEVLLAFGIKYLAIESSNFPHTKGVNNQNFEIKAYSDSPIDLLIAI